MAAAVGYTRVTEDQEVSIPAWMGRELLKPNSDLSQFMATGVGRVTFLYEGSSW